MLGRLSLRARLVLAVLALATVGLVAANVATYSALSSFLIDRTDSTLDETAHSIASAGARRRSADRAARHGGPGSLARREDGDRDRGQADAPGPARAIAVAARRRSSRRRPRRGHEAVSYFTVGSSGDGGRYRVRASIERRRERDAGRRDVARGRRLDAPPPPPDRSVRDGRSCSAGSRRSGSGSSGSACGRSATIGGHGGGDRRRRPVPSRRARRGAHRGRPPRPRAQRDARPDRDVVPRAGGVRAEAAALRRRRVARAAHPARRGARVRRAVRPRRRDATDDLERVDDAGSAASRSG